MRQIVRQLNISVGSVHGEPTHYSMAKYLNAENILSIMNTEIKQIADDLSFIKSEISKIKEDMPSKDMFLTSEESKLLEESFLNEKSGKLVSGKNLRKSLGI